MIEDKTIKAYERLDARVRDMSKEYFHSRPLTNYVLDGKEVSHDLRDVLLLSALTENNVLLSSSTGEGKTHFAKMVMAGLFGNKSKILQMDAGFSLDKLRDMAYDVIANGGRLHDAVKETSLIIAPGIIFDEYNRAPNEIANEIQGWLQNGTLTFEGGRELYPGFPFKNGKYQWKIATVNEGSKYTGAKRLDKASRDRLPVEIPLDIFPSTDEDKRRLGEKISTNVDVSDADGSFVDDVLYLLQEVRSIPISPDAGEFLLYLQRMNQCVKTPNKTKLEIDSFSPEFCKGCHLMREKNNLCGSVYALSGRSRIALQNLAKGFAFSRMAKHHVGEGNVELEDIVAAAPFVLYSKLDIHPGWIDKEAKGSKWQAVVTVLKYASLRFAAAITKNYEHLTKDSEESTKALQKYATEQDAWSYEL